MGRASSGLPLVLALTVLVPTVLVPTVLAPSVARADGPLFRFSANVLALDVVGGGAMDDAMIGGGAFRSVSTSRRSTSSTSACERVLP